MTKNNYCHLLVTPKPTNLACDTSELVLLGRSVQAEVKRFKKMVNGARQEGSPFLSFRKVDFYDDLPVEKIKNWVERCLSAASLPTWQQYQVTLQVCLFIDGEDDTGLCVSAKIVELLSRIGGEVDIASERIHQTGQMSETF